MRPQQMAMVKTSTGARSAGGFQYFESGPDYVSTARLVSTYKTYGDGEAPCIAR